MAVMVPDTKPNTGPGGYYGGGGPIYDSLR